MALPGYATFVPPPGLAELQRLYGYDDPFASSQRTVRPVDMGFVGPGVPLPFDSSIPGRGQTEPMATAGAPATLTPPQALSRGIGPRGRVGPMARAPQMGRPSDAPERPKLDGSAMPAAKAGDAGAGPSIYQQLLALGLGKKKEAAKGPFGIPQSVFNQVGDTGLALMSGRNNQVGRQAAAMMALREQRSREDARDDALQQGEQRLLASGLAQDERIQSQQQIAAMRDAIARGELERKQELDAMRGHYQESMLGMKGSYLDQRERQLEAERLRWEADRASREKVATLGQEGQDRRKGIGVDHSAGWDQVRSLLEAQRLPDGSYPPGVKEKLLQVDAYKVQQMNPTAVRDLFKQGRKDDPINAFIQQSLNTGSAPGAPGATPAPVDASRAQAEQLAALLRSGKLSAEDAEKARNQLRAKGFESLLQ